MPGKKPDEYLSFELSSQAAIHPVITNIMIPIADARRYPGKWYALPASAVEALTKLVEAAEPLRGEHGNMMEALEAWDEAGEI